MAARLVEDTLENLPRGIHGDSVLELRKFIHPLKDGCVWIGTELIAVDARIRPAGQHLVVAGIRKCQAVSDARDAALILIAKNLALLGDNAPEKRKQHFPAFFGVVVPKLAVELLGICPNATVLFVQQGGISAGEDLLPAQAITHNENNVSSFELRPKRLGPEGEE